MRQQSKQRKAKRKKTAAPTPATPDPPCGVCGHDAADCWARMGLLHGSIIYPATLTLPAADDETRKALWWIDCIARDVWAKQAELRRWIEAAGTTGVQAIDVANWHVALSLGEMLLADLEGGDPWPAVKRALEYVTTATWPGTRRDVPARAARRSGALGANTVRREKGKAQATQWAEEIATRTAEITRHHPRDAKAIAVRLVAEKAKRSRKHVRRAAAAAKRGAPR